MKQSVLMAQENQLVELPRKTWEGHLAQAPQHVGARLGFMSAAHHRVRYFVVQELPRMGRPILAPEIAGTLNLPPAQVESILADLEQNLLFLVRNEQGAVVWAFPVTVAPTPHHLTFSTGERVNAA